MGVGIDLLGKLVRCPHCKQKVLAPATSDAPATAPAAPAAPQPPADNPFSFAPAPAAAPQPRPAPAPPPPSPKPVVSSPPPRPPAAIVPPKKIPAPEPEPLPLDDSAEPMFNFTQNQKKELADSILSEPGESEDDVFGSSGANKTSIPTLPEIPPSPPPPAPPTAAAYAQPVPVPVLIPPPAAPAPVTQASANPFAFEMDQSPAPAPTVPQQQPVAPRPVPVQVQSRPVAPQPIPVPVPVPHSTPKPVAEVLEPIEELPEEEPAPKSKTNRGARSRTTPTPSTGIPKAAFFAVVGYAVLVTLAAIYGLFIKSGEKLDPGHPLSTIPDNFGEFDPVSRKKVSQLNQLKLDGELPANLKASLGGKIEVGQLEIEPVKVEIRPLKVFIEGKGEKREENRRDTLVMQMRIKNTSSDLSIFPMDPAFTRKARPDDKEPLTRLVIGKQKTFYGGGIEWPVAANVKRKYEEQQEKDNTPLKPGESREYVVFTDSDPQIVRTVRESNDPILWRVHLRRGLIELKGKDIPVTAIIGVEFKAADVKNSE
jgi:hypothetical protein